MDGFGRCPSALPQNNGGTAHFQRQLARSSAAPFLSVTTLARGAMIYSVDYSARDILLMMSSPSPLGVGSLPVFDSCHSGTVSDWCPTCPTSTTPTGALDAGQVSAHARVRKATPADVISLSGVQGRPDERRHVRGGVAVGRGESFPIVLPRLPSFPSPLRFSFGSLTLGQAFIKAIAMGGTEMHPNQSYQEILHNIRALLFFLISLPSKLRADCELLRTIQIGDMED
ncbi:hypothetical protein B0H14DRAFT_3462220 [Mycena olivaceomarginata]|nr:hypothetical protein B0H14DRAFT_3462220 [Mycena olivaceomarginata]